MKITKVNVSYTRTYQWEQYQPMSYFAAIEAEISEDDNIKDVIKGLKEEVTLQVDDAIKYKKALKEKLLAKQNSTPSTGSQY